MKKSNWLSKKDGLQSGDSPHWGSIYLSVPENGCSKRTPRLWGRGVLI